MVIAGLNQIAMLAFFRRAGVAVLVECAGHDVRKELEYVAAILQYVPDQGGGY